MIALGAQLSDVSSRRLRTILSALALRVSALALGLAAAAAICLFPAGPALGQSSTTTTTGERSLWGCRKSRIWKPGGERPRQ